MPIIVIAHRNKRDHRLEVLCKFFALICSSVMPNDDDVDIVDLSTKRELTFERGIRERQDAVCVGCLRPRGIVIGRGFDSQTVRGRGLMVRRIRGVFVAAMTGVWAISVGQKINCPLRIV